jgi:hypothetical protein
MGWNENVYPTIEVGQEKREFAKEKSETLKKPTELGVDEKGYPNCHDWRKMTMVIAIVIWSCGQSCK